jgi:hypothetical protein
LRWRRNEASAPDNIERLLDFLYTGEVDISKETNNLTAANEVSVLDDFYLSDELKNYVVQVVGQYPGGFKSEDWSAKAAMPSPSKRTEGS